MTLKKEDVEVFEDGVRQEIRSVRVAKSSTAKLFRRHLAEASPSKSKTIEEKVAKPKAEAKAYVEPAKNSVIKYQDRRLLCLLFDMTSMQPPEQLRAQEAAIKFLETQMTSNDLVEIMTFNSNIKIVEEFTADRERTSDHLAQETDRRRRDPISPISRRPAPMKATTAEALPPTTQSSISLTPIAN